MIGRDSALCHSLPLPFYTQYSSNIMFELPRHRSLGQHDTCHTSVELAKNKSTIGRTPTRACWDPILQRMPTALWRAVPACTVNQAMPVQEVGSPSNMIDCRRHTALLMQLPCRPHAAPSRSSQAAGLPALRHPPQSPSHAHGRRTRPPAPAGQAGVRSGALAGLDRGVHGVRLVQPPRSPVHHYDDGHHHQRQ